MRGRHLYIFRSKVKVTTELCQHFGSYTITWVVFNIQISYTDAGWWEEDTYTFWGQEVKDQGHNWTLSTLWFWVYNWSNFQHTDLIFHSCIDAGWWEKDTYTFWDQGVQVHNHKRNCHSDKLTAGPFWLLRCVCETRTPPPRNGNNFQNGTTDLPSNGDHLHVDVNQCITIHTKLEKNGLTFSSKRLHKL